MSGTEEQKSSGLGVKRKVKRLGDDVQPASSYSFYHIYGTAWIQWEFSGGREVRGGYAEGWMLLTCCHDLMLTGVGGCGGDWCGLSEQILFG